MRKIFACLVLAVIMVLGYLPVTTFAAGTTATDFSSKKLTYKIAEVDGSDVDEEDTVYDVLSAERPGQYYVNFYFDGELLTAKSIEDILFYDETGDLIDSTIIDAEYYSKARIWKITYKETVSGKLVLDYDGKLCEMPMNIECKAYFGNEDGEPIDEFIYVPGKSDEFYIYDFSGNVNVKEGGDKVSDTTEADRIKFKVTSCVEEFAYVIGDGINDYEIIVKPPVQGVATAGFYAMEVDNGNVLVGDKIYEMELLNDNEGIAFAFFYNGVPINKNTDLTIVGVNRDERLEEDYEGDLYYDNIVVINGFADNNTSGSVSYGNDSVKFSLKGLNYKLMRYSTKTGEWSELNDRYYDLTVDNEDGDYVRFYFGNEVLNTVKSISFKDSSGNIISDSIIKAEPVPNTNIWLITYLQSIEGTVIVTTVNETYEMSLDVQCEIYFGDANRDKINEFIYEQGVNEVFYLCNYFGTIDELDGADKVDYEEDNGRIKFTVKECQDSFSYVIKIDNMKYEIRIRTLEYSFFAVELVINTDGSIGYVKERLKEIKLFPGQEKYFVFYDEKQMVNIDDSNSVEVIPSVNSVFDGTWVDGYAYEVYFEKGEDEGFIMYDDYRIDVTEREILFYKYENNQLKTIRNTFTYEKGKTEGFYLYGEECPLKASEVIILEDKGYVTRTDEKLEVKGQIIDVVKITVNDSIPSEYKLQLSIPKWDIKMSINIEKVEPTYVAALRGYFTDYNNLTDSTFIGTGDEDIIYDDGDVIYYVWEDTDSCICTVNIRKEEGIDIELIDTGREGLILNGVTYNRYAIKITLTDETNCDELEIEYIKADGSTDEESVELNLVYAYEFEAEGSAEFNYNEEEYVIAFTSSSESEDIVNNYDNGYPTDQKDNEYIKKFPIKIFTVNETDIGDDEFEVYKEVEADFYKNIKDVKAYVGEFNPKTLKYDDISTDALNCLLVKVSKETDGSNNKWYTNITNKNNPGNYTVVAVITMADDTEVTIAMRYKSYEVLEIIKDLSQEDNWGIKTINEYIASDAVQNSDADIINIKLNPTVSYGAMTYLDGSIDEKELKIQGDKEIRIDGNGATIIGSVNVIANKGQGTIPYHKLTNIHFISDKTDINDQNNVCLAGTGQLYAEKCIFENYYIASKMFDERIKGSKGLSGVKNAMTSCVFKNNKYGIYIDGEGRQRNYDKSGYDIKNCKFIGNTYGVYIMEQERVNTINELLEFSHCEFIGNKNDISNQTNFKYLAYGCVFAKPSSDPSLIIEAREPITYNIEKSYVYRESILPCDNGFIVGEPVLPNVAYAPYAENGKLDSFTINNNNNIGVSATNLSGDIDVVGDYNIDTQSYSRYGKWNFNGGGTSI